jgi:hypothetical protein
MVDFLRRYFKLVGFQIGGVKLLREFNQGLVAIFLDTGNDPRHFPGVFLPEGKAASGNGLQFLFGGGGGMPVDFHIVKLPRIYG